jgi:hypothetical protein
MEGVYIVGICAVCACVIGVVAIVFGHGFKSSGPGGFKVETKPPGKK